ncbi:hypothetical protein VPH35_104741 [Triticum aestivum]
MLARLRPASPTRTPSRGHAAPSARLRPCQHPCPRWPPPCPASPLDGRLRQRRILVQLPLRACGSALADPRLPHLSPLDAGCGRDPSPAMPPAPAAHGPPGPASASRRSSPRCPSWLWLRPFGQPLPRPGPASCAFGIRLACRPQAICPGRPTPYAPTASAGCGARRVRRSSPEPPHCARVGSARRSHRLAPARRHAARADCSLSRPRGYVASRLLQAGLASRAVYAPGLIPFPTSESPASAPPPAAPAGFAQARSGSAHSPTRCDRAAASPTQPPTRRLAGSLARSGLLPRRPWF